MGFTEETVRFKLDDSNKILVITMREIKSVSMSVMKLLKNWYATTLRDKESIYNL